jgi:hypothetical protein
MDELSASTKGLMQMQGQLCPATVNKEIRWNLSLNGSAEYLATVNYYSYQRVAVRDSATKYSTLRCKDEQRLCSGLWIFISLCGDPPRAYSIDVLHQKFQFFLQSLIDWLAALSVLLWDVFCFGLVRDKGHAGLWIHGATHRPTPLIWPQGAWYAVLAVFSISGHCPFSRAAWAFQGDHAT